MTKEPGGADTGESRPLAGPLAGRLELPLPAFEVLCQMLEAMLVGVTM